MGGYSILIRPDLLQVFWERMQAGEFITGAVAAGFWIASEYADFPGTDGPLRLVAIIMSCVAAGHLVAAVFSSMFRGR